MQEDWHRSAFSSKTTSCCQGYELWPRCGCSFFFFFFSWGPTMAEACQRNASLWWVGIVLAAAVLCPEMPEILSERSCHSEKLGDWTEPVHRITVWAFRCEDKENRVCKIEGCAPAVHPKYTPGVMLNKYFLSHSGGCLVLSPQQRQPTQSQQSPFVFYK